MRIVRLFVWSAIAGASITMPASGSTPRETAWVVVPFDVSAVQTSMALGSDAGPALARVVSNELERSGFPAERRLVVRGSLIQASASRTGLRGPGAAVRKQTVEVLLAIRLIDPETGEVVAAFDAPGSATETGADVDFVRALISVERNDDDWRSSPMGLAIHRAALRVGEEAVQWSRSQEP